MYIKIKKGSETFKKLSELKKRMDAATKKAEMVCKSIGGEEFYGRSSNGYICGSIDAIKFKESPNPELFRKIQKHPSLWYPKAKNKAAFELMKQLTPINKKELYSIIGWEGFQLVGLVIVDSVGIEFCKEYHLLETYKGSKFTMNDDMEEIMESEYLKLKGK